MAIAGLKEPLEVVTTEPSPVEEAVETTIGMLQRLSLVNDEQALHSSLTGEFTRLVELGKGRLYVRLPAGVKTSQLIELANTLAVERGFASVFTWPPFWAVTASSEWVNTFIPLVTGVAQAGNGLGAFSTCTRHMRQLAAMESFLW